MSPVPAAEFAERARRALREGRRDQALGAAIMAGNGAFREGLARESCPFETDEPLLREAWLRHFDLAAKVTGELAGPPRTQDTPAAEAAARLAEKAFQN